MLPAEIDRASGDVEEESGPDRACGTTRSNGVVPGVGYNSYGHSPCLVLGDNDNEDEDDFSDGDEPIKAVTSGTGMTRGWRRPGPTATTYARSVPGILTSKLPRHLMERWSAIDEDDVHLATLRVYHNTGRLILILPPSPQDGDDGPEQFEGTLSEHDSADRPHSGFVVAHQDKCVLASSVDWECQPQAASSSDTTSSGSGSSHTGHPVPGKRYIRSRMALCGRWTHHCDSLQATRRDLNRLGKRIKARYTAGNSTKRKAEPITTDGLSRLRNQDAPIWILSPPNKRQKTDRMFRLPKDQVLDALFQLFEQKEHWSMKEVRQKTEQPEAYLRDILSDIATFHASGEFRGTWELLPSLRHREGSGSESVQALDHGADVAGEFDAPDEDSHGTDDEVDDDDMEQIA
ncbi:hypothetical protein K466DRAFT_658129 [Polyporus arcularius HHB13444]|uniref:Transcription initiation factor IIF subunit beta n=1 Tax=Polyporus arcularius HHB13444 TaxID=1314778 RepID=A0A5C3PYU5_9APHY|nr:hypothetical protein K466DRAFT_658129 [Polyporus arcularius HHB13444]